ncbi:MAG: metal-sensitive transcriptional regulator [Patescibacteria group bacterium]
MTKGQKLSGDEKILINLKKAQTLLSKIIQMKENKEYCISIMQQNLAVIGLLKSANQEMMEAHLNSCFKAAMKSSDNKRQEEMINEILNVSSLTNK